MEEKTNEVCDNCGSPLILKWGKFGSFYSCSNFSKVKPMTIAAGPWKKDPEGRDQEGDDGVHLPDHRQVDDRRRCPHIPKKS